jgi:outer membrane protein OmpA-like peptidoglycan-associated protein
MNLSRERAEVVRKYLVESGIDAERITTKGYGETQPIADNETDRGRQQNRRVEFTITGYARSSEE